VAATVARWNARPCPSRTGDIAMRNEVHQNYRMLTRRQLLGAAAGTAWLPSIARSYPLTTPVTIALICVPYDSGGTAAGTARAPAVLRQHGLLEEIRTVANIVDYGALPITPSGTVRDAVSGLIGKDAFVRMLDDLQAVLVRALRAGHFPLLIGGDCPILLAGLGALTAVNEVPGLLFVDGHEDAYSPHESPTGETADMEYGFAVGLKTSDWPSDLKARFPLVRPRDAVLLAHRDLSVIQEDRATSVLADVPHYDAKQVATAPAEIVQRALHDLSPDVSAIWLHTDVDALSTKAMPAVDYRLPGGLSWPELSRVVAASFLDHRVRGWDITIYNPDLDPGERVAPQVVEFIAAGVRDLCRRGGSLSK
jgi:arginase